ncbi:MAG: Oxidoreductase [Patescibacteria group bacterium]|nr:Oxidoreductase [Patescibacteria group bacterium]
MYQVVIGGLLLLALHAFLGGVLGRVFMRPTDLLALFVTVVGVSLGANALFARVLGAPRNDASTLITALIAFFLLWPQATWSDMGVAALASVFAIASKYVLAYRKQPLVNPVAFGVFVIGLMGFPAAVWWVGTPWMLPLVILVGGAIVWKIRRPSLAVSAVLASITVTLVRAIMAGQGVVDALTGHLLSWPILFFATVMVTEPQTAPGRGWQQWAYGAGVGALSAVPFHVGPIFSSPELALLLGNLVAFGVSMRQRLTLTLVSKQELAKNTVEYTFSTPYKPAFLAGQYLEWTLPHVDPDARGIRRYFTISSAPSEEVIRLGVRLAAVNGSSFKRALEALPVGGTVFASQRAGDFVLPTEVSTPMVWIAGGIGITPFISMVRELLIRGERRTIVLFFANARAEDVAYREVLDRAEREIGLRTVYLFSEAGQSLSGATCVEGFLTPDILRAHAPFLDKATVFLSGPSGMVTAYTGLVHQAGVPKRRVKTDYFPGFA